MTRIASSSRLTPISVRFLARKGTDGPSLLLIRRISGRRAAEQTVIILANLDTVTKDLDVGAIVVLAEDSLRIRRLPLLLR